MNMSKTFASQKIKRYSSWNKQVKDMSNMFTSAEAFSQNLDK